jgi:predicted RNA-binding Zn-ribbon protein involved in translation (DUF1610 family)
MGAIDTVILNCPVCGKKAERQSKARGWDADGSEFEIADAPIEIAAEFNGMTYLCPVCTARFRIKVQSIVTIRLSDSGDSE